MTTVTRSTPAIMPTTASLLSRWLSLALAWTTVSVHVQPRPLDGRDDSHPLSFGEYTIRRYI